MKTTEIEGVCEDAALYLLCEKERTVGGSTIFYRLYAHLDERAVHRFFVSVCALGEQNPIRVPRASLEEATELWRTLLHAAVTPCHFLDIVEDLDRARYGILS